MKPWQQKTKGITLEVLKTKTFPRTSLPKWRIKLQTSYSSFKCKQNFDQQQQNIIKMPQNIILDSRKFKQIDECQFHSHKSKDKGCNLQGQGFKQVSKNTYLRMCIFNLATMELWTHWHFQQVFDTFQHPHSLSTVHINPPTSTIMFNICCKLV